MAQKIYLKSIFMIVAASMIYGCTTTTHETIKNSAKGKVTVEIDENYESVYRRLGRNFSACYTDMQVHISKENYPSQQQAEITVSANYGLIWLVEINSLESQKTRVKGYFDSALLDHTHFLYGWLNGKRSGC
jgi:ribosome-associated translation inhibitor RaiA